MQEVIRLKRIEEKKVIDEQVESGYLLVGSPDKKDRSLNREHEIRSMADGLRSKRTTSLYGGKSPMEDSKYGTMISSVVTSSPERSAKINPGDIQ